MAQGNLATVASKDAFGIPVEVKLFQAIKRGDRYAVAAALNECPNIQTPFAGKSFLQMAGESGHREICEWLVAKGADPNQISGKRQYSLLHRAALSGNYGFASILLELSASPSPRCSHHATPLHIAARSGQGYLTYCLLEHFAEVNAQDKSGRTPLLLALTKGHIALANILVKHNGDARLPDRRGVTALQVAEGLLPTHPEILPIFRIAT